MQARLVYRQAQVNSITVAQAVFANEPQPEHMYRQQNNTWAESGEKRPRDQTGCYCRNDKRLFYRTVQVI